MSISFTKSEYFEHRYIVRVDNKGINELDTRGNSYSVNVAFTSGKVDNKMLYEAYKQDVPLILSQDLYSIFRSHHTVREYEHYYRFKTDPLLSIIFGPDISKYTLDFFLHTCYLYGVIDTRYDAQINVAKKDPLLVNYVPNKTNWKDILKLTTRYDIVLAINKIVPMNEILKQCKILDELTSYRLYTDGLITRDQALKHSTPRCIVACDLHLDHKFVDVDNDDTIDYLLTQSVKLENIVPTKNTKKYNFLL